jgi:hypothetical protein
MRGLPLYSVEVRFVIPFREVRSALDRYALSTTGTGSCGVLSVAVA